VCAPARAHAECGQATPEWVGLFLVLAMLLAGAAAGLDAPPLGFSLARALGAKLVCAVDLSDSCRRDPELVAAYGADLAAQVRDHAPEIVYEHGMRALPVDFRSCRSASCADGAPDGLVRRSRRGEPVTAFVHVIDCRAGMPPAFAGANPPTDCSASRAGNLYLQYWLYYPDSATLRGVPVAGAKGYHRDDWEGYQVRIDADADADARASSHHGFNYEQGEGNWASDLGFGPANAVAEAVGIRNGNGWGPETGFVFISGGSHAGNVRGSPGTRYTLRRYLRLVPLEPIAVGEQRAPYFAISPPWMKDAWFDPEAEGTD
jgi:hypothetical protein